MSDFFSPLSQGFAQGANLALTRQRQQSNEQFRRHALELEQRRQQQLLRQRENDGFTALLQQEDTAIDQLLDIVRDRQQSGAGNLEQAATMARAALMQRNRFAERMTGARGIPTTQRDPGEVDLALSGGTLSDRAAAAAKAEVAGVQARADALQGAGINTTFGEQARLGGLLPDSTEPTFASNIGKLINDRRKAAQIFGEDSEQVRILDAAIATEEELEPADFSDITGLQKTYAKQSAGFVTAAEGFERVVAAAEDGTDTGDIALVFAFMKTLDPGSRITEGEFATAENAGGIDERVRGQYNRILSGERLTPDQRQRFTRTAAQQFLTTVESQRLRDEAFRDMAVAGNFDPGLVVRPIVPPETVEKARTIAAQDRQNRPISPSDQAVIDSIMDGSLTGQAAVRAVENVPLQAVRELQRLRAEARPTRILGDKAQPNPLVERTPTGGVTVELPE